MDKDALHPVARFPTQMEAEIARGILESAGILCFLFAENDVITKDAGFGSGQVLMVRQSDIETAKAILQSIQE